MRQRSRSDRRAAVGETDRQRVAHELGFSETIFIDDPTTGVLRIFTPAVELPLAGHPLVGAAWLLRHEDDSPALLSSYGPRADSSGPGGIRTGNMVERATRQLAGLDADPVALAVAIDDLSGPLLPSTMMSSTGPGSRPGLVRMRGLAPRFGITEDEATGSAALRLTTALGQPIDIRQGRGSVLNARPIDHATGRQSVVWSWRSQPLGLPYNLILHGHA